jgi:cobalamin synthase
MVFGVASYFKSRLGGLTGDTYGAINELAEVLVLLILIIIVRFQ